MIDLSDLPADQRAEGVHILWELCRRNKVRVSKAMGVSPGRVHQLLEKHASNQVHKMQEAANPPDQETFK